MNQPNTRRDFLAGIGAASALPLLHLPPDEAEDLAALGRLCGIEFTEAERKQAAGKLKSQLQAFTALRNAEVPFELAPCMTFDPVPTGQPLPATGPGAKWQALGDVALPATDTDLAFASVDELASLLRSGKVTSRQLTELCIVRLKKFDPELHCVVTLLEEGARKAADAADAELKAGKPRGPLHGIPYGAKDLFAWPTAPTTFGAEPYREQVWQLKATVLQKLEAQGAVLVAKLSLGALAQGDLWFAERTRNPFNPERGSSGSSAGPASAVAAGLLPFAIGTETLGSIVSPCRACGTGGLRTTFGTVSRHGAMPLSWTMDKVGPIARSAVDLAMVFDCIRGADGLDPAARTAAFPWQRGRGIKDLRIGLLQDNQVRDDERAFVKWLEEQGCKPVPVTLPQAPYQALRLMLHAEAATAFDDLTRSGNLKQLKGQGNNDWPNDFRAARAIPAVEYLRASRIRTRLMRDMAAVMEPIDVLVSLGQNQSLLCTNLTGHPTLVTQVGAGENGRPNVIQLIGKLYGEAALLSVAELWQQETEWHKARPKLTA